MNSGQDHHKVEIITIYKVFITHNQRYSAGYIASHYEEGLHVRETALLLNFPSLGLEKDKLSKFELLLCTK